MSTHEITLDETSDNWPKLEHEGPGVIQIEIEPELCSLPENWSAKAMTDEESLYYRPSTQPSLCQQMPRDRKRKVAELWTSGLCHAKCVQLKPWSFTAEYKTILDGL